MTPRRTVFRRYSILVSSALVGMVCLSAAIEIAFSASENLERVQALHASEARAASRPVELFFHEVERNFRAVGSSPWSRGLSLADRAREYRRVMRLLPAIRDVTTVDAEGREILFISRSEPERISSGNATAIPDDTFDSSNPLVRVRIRDEDGTGSTTIVTVSLQFVSAELLKQPRVGGETIYVLDQRRAVVARAGGGANTPASGQTAMAGAGSEWRRDAEGRMVLAVWHSLVTPPWTFVVESPWRDVLQPVLDAAYRALAIVAAALVFSLVIGRWLANRLAQPVMRLKEGAVAFGAGELDRRIDLRTGDELEELAREFNAMADQLKEYTAGLEQKVDEKTEELRVALGVAQDAMRAKAIFLAAASHDLRQPLYAISLLSDALAGEALPDHAAKVLAKQRQAIAVMRTLFDNLLDLSRFDAGDVRPVLREIPLRDALQPLVAEYEVVCRAKGLAWRCDVAEAWIRTDPELARRLVGNLLSNAVRYTRRGEVTLLATVAAGSAVIEVADTGVGSAREDQMRVFDEFVQLNNPGRHRDEGVGLGLAIVRRISDLLGAGLRMESAKEKGTRFWIEFPVVAPAVLPPRVALLAESTPRAFAGLNAWIVDDEPLIRDALRTQFEMWGALPRFALDRAGIERLYAETGEWPDVAILDDMLGNDQGLEIAEWLGTRMPRARIVLVTGNVNPARMRQLERSGFVVLMKPLAAQDLAQWISDALALADEPA